MAYVFEPSAPVSHEVRRVVTERLAEAISRLEAIDDADSADIERAVHDVRKRCKEARSVARLVRSSIGGEYRRFNRRVRDAADILAPIRDAHATLAAFDNLRSSLGRSHDADLTRVRTGQVDAAEEATRTINRGDPRVAEARQLLAAAQARVALWDLDDGFAPLGAGIQETYRRGARARRRASDKPTDHRFHEWRKSVKHLLYQVRLIERAAPSALTPLVAGLSDLAEALGDDHDLAVLVERMATDPARFGGEHNVDQVRHVVRAEQDDLRRRALRLGATIYAESPSAFTRRMREYWNRTERDGPELPTGGIAELAADEHRSSAADGTSNQPSTVERERKFLVAELPEVPATGLVLKQGYLAVDGRVAVRVRDAGREGHTLTIKAGHGAVRTEIELELSPDQFAAAWEQTGGRRIHKTRHRLAVGDHMVDLDVFHDDLDGLVLAEVEFDSDETLAAFEPPDWFGPEVTDDVEYTNAALAMNAPRGRPTTKPAA